MCAKREKSRVKRKRKEALITMAISIMLNDSSFFIFGCQFCFCLNSVGVTPYSALKFIVKLFTVVKPTA